MLRVSTLALCLGLASPAVASEIWVTNEKDDTISVIDIDTLMQFAGDTEAKLGEAFCQQALARGVYLHNKHNMFLNLAHTDAVIDEALEAIDAAFAALPGATPA